MICLSVALNILKGMKGNGQHHTQLAANGMRINANGRTNTTINREENAFHPTKTTNGTRIEIDNTTNATTIIDTHHCHMHQQTDDSGMNGKINNIINIDTLRRHSFQPTNHVGINTVMLGINGANPMPETTLLMVLLPTTPPY